MPRGRCVLGTVHCTAVRLCGPSSAAVDPVLACRLLADPMHCNHALRTQLRHRSAAIDPVPACRLLADPMHPSSGIPCSPVLAAATGHAPFTHAAVTRTTSSSRAVRADSAYDFVSPAMSVLFRLLTCGCVMAAARTMSPFMRGCTAVHSCYCRCRHSHPRCGYVILLRPPLTVCRRLHPSLLYDTAIQTSPPKLTRADYHVFFRCISLQAGCWTASGCCWRGGQRRKSCWARHPPTQTWT